MEPLEPLLKGATDLISSGFLGTLVVVEAYIIVYLFREKKAERKQFDADIDDERSKHSIELSEERKKHSIEIAEQRKLNMDLQSDRLAEVKAAFAEVTKALSTVASTLAFLQGGSK